MFLSAKKSNKIVTSDISNNFLLLYVTSKVIFIVNFNTSIKLNNNKFFTQKHLN